MDVKAVKCEFWVYVLFCFYPTLTFDSDINSLRDEQLWLDEHAADVGPFVHHFLDIAELQGPILKNHLDKYFSFLTITIHSVHVP